MELIPVFDMRKLADEELETVQTIIEWCTKHGCESDEPGWHAKYHMCRVNTMKRQGYICNPAWITYVPRNKVRKPSDNVKAYKKGEWTL